MAYSLPWEFAASARLNERPKPDCSSFEFLPAFMLPTNRGNEGIASASPAQKTLSSNPPAFIGYRLTPPRFQALPGGCNLSQKNLLLGHATADEQPGKQ
jgi:hypothetical protein